MTRVALSFVFVSAGLISTTAGAVEERAAGTEDWRLAVHPQSIVLGPSVGLPVISTAAFDTKFLDVPISSRPAVACESWAEPSFVKWSDKTRSVQSSIDDYGNLIHPPAVSANLAPNLPSPFDAGASPTHQMGGITLGAIHVTPLGVVSSR